MKIISLIVKVMHKGLILILMIISMTINPVLSLELTGRVYYTVETARTEAFSNIPLSINISDYASYFSDPNYIANKKAINKKKAYFRDRYLTFFSSGEYGVIYKNNKSISYYYDKNGKLESISFLINKSYPIKVVKYDKHGKLDSTALAVSSRESYVFDTNKKFISHWKGNNCYNENGELIITREKK